MLKEEMRKALVTALNYLEETGHHAAFVHDTREILARGTTTDGKEPSRTLWRLAELTNPRTGRDIIIEVGKTGRLTPSDQKRTGGILYVDEWVEVQAGSRAEARQRVDQGEGQWYHKAGHQVWTREFFDWVKNKGAADEAVTS